jgi:hypothetical protein
MFHHTVHKLIVLGDSGYPGKAYQFGYKCQLVKEEAKNGLFIMQVFFPVNIKTYEDRIEKMKKEQL